MGRPLESTFQANLIRELKDTYSGGLIFKIGSNGMQGFADILILYEDKWAALECKRGRNSKKQPNQEYYVDRMNKMSFSRFISPENKEEVLCELQSTLRPKR
jgi:hypothetical protein